MKSILLLICVGVLCLAACAPSATPSLTAQQIAQKATEKSATINSFHFTIDLSGRSKTIDPLGTLVLRHADGDVVRPDRAHSNIKVAMAGFVVALQATGIGSRQWLTNPLSQRWEQAPANWGYNPAVLFDAQNGLGALLGKAKGLTRGADDQVDGRPHYRLTGAVDGNAVSPMTAGMVTGNDVTFTLWIGADDFITRKVHMIEKENKDSDPTEWDIVLSAFDQLVTIEPPPL